MKKRFVLLLVALSVLCALLPLSASAETALAKPVVSISTDVQSGYPKLTWVAVDGATEYEIYRCDSEGDYYQYREVTTDTTYVDTYALLGELYRYKVVAFNRYTYIASAESSAVGRTCKLPQPNVSISLAESSGKPQLTWDEVYGATKYAIYRRLGSSGEYAYYTSTTSTAYTDKNAAAGTKYCYKVKAIHSNSAANSVDSAAVGKTAKLAQPKVTISNVASTGKIQLKWNAVSGTTKYAIYRRTGNSGDYTYYTSTTSTTYTDKNAKIGTKYCYKVIAIHSSSAGNSARSAAVGKTAKLAQPKVTSSNVISSGKIKLSWNAVSGAKKYAIYRLCDDYDYDYEYYTSTTSTAYVDSGAEAEYKYLYKVVAVHSNTAANSAKSGAVGKTCKLAQPKVTIYNAYYSGVPELYWDTVSGADSYVIYRRTGSSGSYYYYDATADQQTYYTDEYAQAGTLYTYKIQAVGDNENAGSALSSAAGKTCKLTCPDVYVDINNRYPEVHWDKVMGAKSYKVYRSTSSYEGYKYIGSTSSLKYRDTSANRNKCYYYEVVAVHSKAAANSSHSYYVEIDLPLALLADEYDVAVCALDAGYEAARVPSSIILERAYYTDSSSFGNPMAILECSALNGYGGRGIIYITAVVFSEEEYEQGSCSYYDKIYEMDDGYVVACNAREYAPYSSYDGFRKLSLDKIIDEY